MRDGHADEAPRATPALRWHVSVDPSRKNESERPANRLAREASPYLRQHAHNPVDWWAWGSEAFAEARRRDVPIFLSIGYSTCYWCHVMERESFESDAIAGIMNEAFVCVKVDREERPDVDDLYMAATQIMSGHGGWPMSCFLEPRGLQPFFCGTYFPPESRFGRPGFVQVLEGLSRAWREKRSEVEQQAAALANEVRDQIGAGEAARGLSLDQVSSGVQSLLRMLDRTNGGFGGAPKFPQPVFLELLLDVRERAGDDATREAIDAACRLTLDRMAVGGLFDQVGGGFHRYSVDAEWTVPHFEKMLYDNAQLGVVYARAAAMYHDAFYRRVAERTFAYVEREMSRGEGFFSAQDAEVDGREGANYIWTPEEVRGALMVDGHDGPRLTELAGRAYSLDRPANFADPHHPGQTAHILRLTDRPERVAIEVGVGHEALERDLERINAILLDRRSGRPQPRLDDKRIASWNGMMIAALSRAARLASGEIAKEHASRWLDLAKRAMSFVLACLVDSEGSVRRVPSGTSAGSPGFLEDAAQVIAALLELHRAGIASVPVERAGVRVQAQTLAEARRICSRAVSDFGDGSGSFFDARDGQADLFVRPRSSHDGALPSGASQMLLNLIDLHALTGEAEYLDRALACAGSMSGAIARAPAGAANALRGVLRLATMEPAVAARLATLGPPSNDEPTVPPDFTPVEVYANAERVRVGRETPAVIRLVVRIAPGYHINAADLGAIAGTRVGRSLVPLRVHVLGGTGIAVYADYPSGVALATDDARSAEGAPLVHAKEIEFRVVIEREGEWSGRPLLGVTYQACTDRECLAPRTVELDVAIDRAD